MILLKLKEPTGIRHPALTASGKAIRSAAIFCSAFILTFVVANTTVATEQMAAAPARRGALTQLAEAEFPNLTRAERALLNFADIRNRAGGDFAYAGTVAVAGDPSNDPSYADKWGEERSVRAELIRWLCVDPDASRQVDPRGIRLLGARINGKLDLSHVRVPFAIALVRCFIPARINLDSAEIPTLDLSSSYTGEIFGPSVVVDGDAIMGGGVFGFSNPYRASGEIFLHDARIGGVLDFGGGKFHYSLPAQSTGLSQKNSKPSVDMSGSGDEMSKPAIDIGRIQVKGAIYMAAGFESIGAVKLPWATAGALQCSGGHFMNPGNVALVAAAAKINGDVTLAEFFYAFEAAGLVSFSAAAVAGNLYVHKAKFKGAPSDKFGFDASGIEVRKAMVWQAVELDGGSMNLAGATVKYYFDDEKSWPKRGNLLLDGFTYDGLGPPTDAPSRLRWLALQPPGLHLQPYRQLAKFLHESGDEQGARQVLIASEDARYRQLGVLNALWGVVLKWTIGYGHQPLLTVMWALAVILVGWVIVMAASEAGLMRATFPESLPSGTEYRHERLHPLLYSIDVFFPFVNLHQEHYWWPDSELVSDWRVLGGRVRLRGSLVRYYLWFEIGTGWLLSAIFLAGVTGLLKTD